MFCREFADLSLLCMVLKFISISLIMKSSSRKELYDFFIQSSTNLYMVENQY